MRCAWACVWPQVLERRGPSLGGSCCTKCLSRQPYLHPPPPLGPWCRGASLPHSLQLPDRLGPTQTAGCSSAGALTAWGPGQGVSPPSFYFQAQALGARRGGVTRVPCLWQWPSSCLETGYSSPSTVLALCLGWSPAGLGPCCRAPSEVTPRPHSAAAPPSPHCEGLVGPPPFSGTSPLHRVPPAYSTGLRLSAQRTF